MSDIAFALPMCWSQPRERKAGRARLWAERESHCDDTIAVGHVSTLPINRQRKNQFPMIGADAPFIDQKLLNVFQEATYLAVKDQTPICGNFNLDIFGFQPGHGSRNRQAFICAIDFHRNLLLFGLFVHMTSPFLRNATMRLTSFNTVWHGFSVCGRVYQHISAYTLLLFSVADGYFGKL